MARSLFEFDDYRKYLADWIKEAKKEKKSHLSHLAGVAQVHPTYMSQILSGLKDLNLEQAALISHFIDHSLLERDYFFNLIQLARAGNQTLRDYLNEKNKEIQKQKNSLEKRFDKHRALSDSQKAQFYSDWRYAAILLSTDIDNGQTLEQIAERFSLKRNKAEEYLNFLIEMGSCKKSGVKYKWGDVHIHEPAHSPFVLKHHSNWRLRSLNNMNEKRANDLFFTGPLAVSESDFKIIRERTNVFIKEVVELAKASTSEKVICLNLDLFKVTGPASGETR